MISQLKITVSDTVCPPRNPDWHRKIKSRREILGEALNNFWNSGWYFPVILGITALFMFSGLTVVGMVALALFFILTDFLCEDLMMSLTPIVLLFVMGVDYYDKLSSLLPLVLLIPVYVVSLAYNLLHWRIHLVKGACFKSLVAVAAATMLGGIGVISAKEYFALSSFYFTVVLGPFMLLFSVIAATDFTRPKPYVIADRFAAILYTVGIFTGLAVVSYYIQHFAEIDWSQGLPFISSRNYLTTMLLLALPMPFRMIKKDRRSIAGAVFIYAALLMTGSRSALVFGTIIAALSIFFCVYQGRTLTRRERVMLIPFLAAAGCIIFLLGQTVLSARLVDGQLFPVTDSRVAFFKQALMDFWQYPIAGIGLSNMKNSVIFLGVGGSIVWYHNYFAQIIGSMGLIGVFAYGWLLKDRFGLVKRMYSSGDSMLMLSYIGMFLVSMTNPGEFCPLPNELMVVIIFNVAMTLTAAPAASTVSGESMSVSWTPGKRAVPLGEYSRRSNTVSLCTGIDAKIVVPGGAGEGRRESACINGEAKSMENDK